MPFTSAQSLTADQVYAVSAYILYLNNIITEDTVLDATSLPKVEMPNRDGLKSKNPALSAQKIHHNLVHRLRCFAGYEVADVRNDVSRIAASEVFVFALRRIRQSRSIRTALDHESRDRNRLRRSGKTVEVSITWVLIRLAPTHAIGMPGNLGPIR